MGAKEIRCRRGLTGVLEARFARRPALKRSFVRSYQTHGFACAPPTKVGGFHLAFHELNHLHSFPPVLFPFLLTAVPRHTPFDLQILAGLAAFDEVVFIHPHPMEGQLPARKAVREILRQDHGFAHRTLPFRLHAMRLGQSHPDSAALGALQLDVHNRRNRSLGLMTDRLRFQFGKRSQPVLTALAEALPSASGADRPAGLADGFGARSARKGALAGRIESGRLRHLAAYEITDRRAPPTGFLFATSGITG